MRPLQPPTPTPRLRSSPDIPIRAPASPSERPEPLYKRAPVTAALIVANIVVFIGQALHAGWLVSGLAAEQGIEGTSPLGLALQSMMAMPRATLLAFGANDANLTLYDGRWQALLASCFVHGSLLHIAFNIVALRQIGPFVERIASPARMLPLYLGAGIAGSAASTFFGWLSTGQRLSVGASGAICGLIGAALVLGYRIEGKDSPIMRAMGRWLLIILGMGLTVSLIVKLQGAGGGFDNAAHGGGAVAGAVIAMTWRRGSVYTPAVRNAILAGCIFLVAAVAARVLMIDLVDPYAMYTADDRVAHAEQQLAIGRCEEADRALKSLDRISPEAKEVQRLRVVYRQRCR